MRMRALVVLALVMLVAAGCSVETAPARPLQGASISGAKLSGETAGERMPFTVRTEEAGQEIGVDCRGATTRGTLRVQLLAGDGAVVWQQEAGPGPFAVNTVIRPERAAEYRLGLAWGGPVSGSYNLRWQPGAIEVSRVSPLALFPGLGMVAVALAFVVYAARRRLGWGYLGLGALAWVVAVAGKFAWAGPGNPPIYRALYAGLPASLAGPVFYVYVGSLTGLFEVLPVWLVLRYTRLGRVAWPRALGFGIGFGAVEALLLGVVALGSTLTALLAPTVLPLEALEAVGRQAQPLYGLAPIVERVAAILIHTLANVLLFYGVARRQARWLWLAFAYKTAIDSVAAFGQLWGLTTPGRIWAIEAVAILFGVVGYLGLHGLAARYPAEAVAGAELVATKEPGPA